MIKITALFFAVFLLGVITSWRFFEEQSSNVPNLFQGSFEQSAKPELLDLSLENIFSDSHSVVSNLPQKRVVTVIATGDIIPARSVNTGALRRTDFTWPYLKTADFLKNADIAFANLESPLVKNCPTREDGMIFCGDEGNLQGLLFGGIDVVNLANNHAGNWGLAGVDNTTNLLNKNGILVTGRDGPVFKEVRGLKFAFLGYNDIGAPETGLSWADPIKIGQEIAQAKKQADLVIVTFHWGVEYTSQPTEKQKQLAHLAINSGADLIIGNHPHWIQPVEIYRDKIIAYAHGNFIFDQMWSEKTKLGIVGKYTFYDKQLIDVQFFPIQIKDYGQPYFLESGLRNFVLQEMKTESLKLNQL